MTRAGGSPLEEHHQVLLVLLNTCPPQSSSSSAADPFLQVKLKLEDYLDHVAFRLRRRMQIKRRRQVKIFPVFLGDWGTEKYGKEPIKVDAISFWSDR